jgi:hypothetical protein
MSNLISLFLVISKQNSPEGGWHNMVFFKDFYQFNTLTNLWNIINSDIGPNPISNHSCVVLQNKFHFLFLTFRFLVLFGGFNGLQTNNDVFVYDLKNGKWSSAFQNSKVPMERDSHSCCVRKETNEMIVFGGRTLGYQATVYMNDLHCMSLKMEENGDFTSEWKPLSEKFFEFNFRTIWKETRWETVAFFCVLSRRINYFWRKKRKHKIQ